jgi:gamma-butyrobetaine dioxygenase
VDGFAAAALRAADPESFGVLTGTPVPFRYVDKETELTACQPVISLSPRGRIAGIRYHERSMLPPRPADGEAFSAASSGAGERHLQGCYADLDGLLSTLAVLRPAQ